MNYEVPNLAMRMGYLFLTNMLVVQLKNVFSNQVHCQTIYEIVYL